MNPPEPNDETRLQMFLFTLKTQGFKKKKIPKTHEKASWSGVEACLDLGGLDPAWV